MIYNYYIPKNILRKENTKMKKVVYNSAEIEVIRFASEDIVTTSDSLTHVDQSDSSWD